MAAPSQSGRSSDDLHHEFSQLELDEQKAHSLNQAHNLHRSAADLSDPLAGVYRDLGAPPPLSSITDTEVYRSIQVGSGFAEEVDQPVWRSVSHDPLSAESDSVDSFASYHSSHKELQHMRQPFTGHFSSLNPKHAPTLIHSAFSQSQVEIEIEPPEVPGGYLEPCYHFVSESRPCHILNSLLTTLQSNEVDFSVKQDKYKISCRSYRHADALTFIVRIFSAKNFKPLPKPANPNNKQYAVEFQRRTGDILKFSELYRSCKHSLHLEGHCESSRTDSLPSSRLPAPSLPDNAATADQVVDSLNCLLLMASSTYVDVKANAMHVLSEVTATDRRVQDMVLSASGLETLLESLHTKFEDVHRCALTTLANLADKRVDVCRKIVSGRHIRQVYELTNSETLQVVRESARILNHIVEELGKSVVDSEFSRTLRSLCTCTDPHVKQTANHLVTSLQIM
jgi:hypothetical protein